jgi:hypothetical protein
VAPNNRLKLTGAAIPISRDIKMLQVARQLSRAFGGCVTWAGGEISVTRGN